MSLASTRLIVNKWIRNYSKAWLKKDANAIAVLFSEDASYHSHPFRQGTQGKKGVLDYAIGALDVEEIYEARFGRPIIEGPRAAVEYWATMKEKVEDVTLAGCVTLKFSQRGLCKELHDYWILQTGRHSPPPEWGK